MLAPDPPEDMQLSSQSFSGAMRSSRANGDTKR